MKRKSNIEYLKKGDLVAIACIAKYINLTKFHKSIERIKLEGFNILKTDKTVLKRSGMFSGDEKDRIEHFQNLLDNPNIRAIFFARGGYGTIRIIDKLRLDQFYKKPKWLIGFSDITTIFSHIHTNYNIPVIHAPMIYNFPQSSKKSLSMLFAALKGNLQVIKIRSHNLNKPGFVESEIVGGNLSILCSLLASKSLPIMDKKILFIEDVDEYLYSIDRMFFSLKRANVFSKISGLIIGKFTKISDNKPSFGQSLEKLIYNHIKDFNFPFCFNFPSGHIKNNLPIFLGKSASLNIGDQVLLEYK